VGVLGPLGPLGARLGPCGVELIEQDLSGFFLADVLRIGSLVKEVKKFKPDVLHVADASLARHGAVISQLTGIPYILTVHSALFREGKLSLAHDRVRRVIAVTEQIRQALVNQAHVPRDKVTLVENGVESSEDVATPSLRNEIPLVGVFGPLVRGSGLKYFLRVARSVVDAGGQANFAILGEGALDTKLRRAVREMALSSRVVITLPSAEYRRLLSSLDVFLLPFIDEGFGFAVLEAMACAKPVVVSGIGGAYSLVQDGRTGYLVQRKDVLSFARRVLDLLRDPEGAREMGRQGRELALARFPLAAMVEKTAAIHAGSAAPTPSAAAGRT
jgi:glycosyltransferase involved in cell wall biosynthesis